MFTFPMNHFSSPPAGGGGNLPTQSIAFSDTQYMNTNAVNATATDHTKVAYSAWVKMTSYAGQSILYGVEGRSEGIGYRASDTSVATHWRSVAGGSPGTDVFSPSGKLPATGSWAHIALYFDSTQASSTDRIKAYVNGADVGTFSGTMPALNDSFVVHAAGLGLWCGGAGADFGIGAFSGLIFQPCWFVDTLPAISSLYSSGHPVDVTSLPGLISLLNTNTTDAITKDFCFGTAWGNTHGATKSSDIPT